MLVVATLFSSTTHSYSHAQLRTPAAPELCGIRTMVELDRTVLRSNTAPHYPPHAKHKRHGEDELRASKQGSREEAQEAKGCCIDNWRGSSVSACQGIYHPQHAGAACSNLSFETVSVAMGSCPMITVQFERNCALATTISGRPTLQASHKQRTCVET